MTIGVEGVRESDLVFVAGALRSGTTVFRLILDAHPQVTSPGEFDFISI
jgi:Sulfotransferase family